MVLIAHPAVAMNIKPPLQPSSNDPGRAQTMHPPIARGLHTIGAKNQQPRPLIGPKISLGALGDPPNCETIPQCPATARDALKARAKEGQVPESVGNKKTTHKGERENDSSNTTHAQVQQTRDYDRGQLAYRPNRPSLPPKRQTQYVRKEDCRAQLLSTSPLVGRRSTASLTPDTRSASRPNPMPGRVRQPSKWSPSGPRSPAKAHTAALIGSMATGELLTWCEKRRIQIGIETEFIIAAMDQNDSGAILADFVETLADNHNEKLPKQHPRMLNILRPYRYEGSYNRWCLVEDFSLVGSSTVQPWGLELVSPIFRAFPGSRWRENVEATWTYLTNHYEITANDNCSTHIHISLDPVLSSLEVKRIAQAVIHFEPAFEALVPPARRQNDFVKSNWLDSPTLSQEDKSRSELISAIEAEGDTTHLIKLMQSKDNRNFGWNFWPLFGKGSIEFRKPPASTTLEEVLSWAELTLSFVQTAIRCETAQQLQEVPPTIGGLRWFVLQSAIPGMNEPARMHRLWEGKDPGAALEPVPNCKAFWVWEGEKKAAAMARLKALAAADQRRIDMLKQTAREPYW